MVSRRVWWDVCKLSFLQGPNNEWLLANHWTSYLTLDGLYYWPLLLPAFTSQLISYFLMFTPSRSISTYSCPVEDCAYSCKTHAGLLRHILSFHKEINQYDGTCSWLPWHTLNN